MFNLNDQVTIIKLKPSNKSTFNFILVPANNCLRTGIYLLIINVTRDKIKENFYIKVFYFILKKYISEIYVHIKKENLIVHFQSKRPVTKKS